MNLYNKNIRFEDEDDEPKATPENPMEKMMTGWQFDKKFIEQRKVFLWGVVDDKSAKDITDRLMYLEAIDPGKEITFYINSPEKKILSYLLMLRKYEYLLFAWWMDQSFPIQERGVATVWIKQLGRYQEFRDVHASQKHFYPEFGIFVDALIAQSKYAGWMYDSTIATSSTTDHKLPNL